MINHSIWVWHCTSVSFEYLELSDKYWFPVYEVAVNLGYGKTLLPWNNHFDTSEACLEPF